MIFTTKKMKTPPYLRRIFDIAEIELKKTLEIYENSSKILKNSDESFDELKKEAEVLRWLLSSDVKRDPLTGFGIFEKLAILWKRDRRAPANFEEFITNYFLIDHQEIWEKSLEHYPKKYGLEIILERINQIYYGL